MRVEVGRMQGELLLIGYEISVTPDECSRDPSYNTVPTVGNT